MPHQKRMDGNQGELINRDSFKPCFGKTWVAMLICRLRGVLRFCSFKSVHSYTATGYYQSFLTRHACTSLIICLRCEWCTWQVYPTKWGKHRLWTPYLKMWGQPTMWLRSGTASDAMHHDNKWHLNNLQKAAPCIHSNYQNFIRRHFKLWLSWQFHHFDGFLLSAVSCLLSCLPFLLTNNLWTKPHQTS